MKTLLIACVLFFIVNAANAQIGEFPRDAVVSIAENTTVEGALSADAPLAAFEFIAPHGGWMVIFHGVDFEARRQKQTIGGPSRGGGEGYGVFDNQVDVELIYVLEGDIFRVAFSSLDGDYGRYTVRYEYVDLDAMPVLDYGETVETRVDSNQLFQIYTVDAELGDALAFEYGSAFTMLFQETDETQVVPNFFYPVYLSSERETTYTPIFLTNTGNYAVVLWSRTLATQEESTFQVEALVGTLAELPQFVRLTEDAPEQTLTFTPPGRGPYLIHVRFHRPQTSASLMFRQNGVPFLELSGATMITAPMDIAGYFSRSSTEPIDITITGLQFAAFPFGEETVDLTITLTACGKTRCLP